ncbi:MAG: N-acyl homoserine lactonase family protein [Proteobacteria bacterium]|nr:N-acyl homoserine lactonase family protein [Pseudomonadota bacterium]MCP4917622.1 N-acyl homoserine lactonase family protein [Pseudomonadota bacterium]
MLISLLACFHLPEPPVAGSLTTPEPTALPGGSLRVMHVATMTMRESDALAEGFEGTREGVISAYLFDHPTQGLVLIDTAFGRRTFEDPKDYPGPILSGLLDELELKRPPVEYLADLDKTAADVEHVVVTHLHYDHAGGLEDFPDATLHIDPVEWDAGTKHEVWRGYNPTAYKRRDNVELLAFDGPSIAGFDRTHDVFGDGSLMLLSAPGHTPGHSLVLLNLPGGSFLFLGDAAWLDDNWQLPMPKGAAMRRMAETDWEAAHDVCWQVKRWAEADPSLTVVAGHEIGNVDALKVWPQAYE